MKFCMIHNNLNVFDLEKSLAFYRTDRVYTCGLYGIVAWRYDADQVTLTKEKEYPAPRKTRYFGGHDLTMDPRNGKLLVSGAERSSRNAW